MVDGHDDSEDSGENPDLSVITEIVGVQKKSFSFWGVGEQRMRYIDVRKRSRDIAHEQIRSAQRSYQPRFGLESRGVKGRRGGWRGSKRSRPHCLDLGLIYLSAPCR